MGKQRGQQAAASLLWGEAQPCRTCLAQEQTAAADKPEDAQVADGSMQEEVEGTAEGKNKKDAGHKGAAGEI